LILVVVLSVGATASGGDGGGPSVEIIRAPQGGIQPQAAIDRAGVIHLVYFRGDPAGGDLYYVRREPNARDFSAAIRVNSQPGSAVAIGTIRGAQLALGRGGRVHVAWNGSQRARPLNHFGSTPMLYARSTEDGRAFEDQRNLMLQTSVLDG